MAGHVPISQEELVESIDKAKMDNRFMHWERRSGVKLPQGSGKIAVCIPIGPKRTRIIHECPNCKKRTANTEDILGHGLIPMEFLQNTQQIVNPIMTGVHYYARKSVPSARAREEMAHDAMEQGVKYIFFWDDDVILPSHAIYDLHIAMEREPDVGIISGVYLSRHDTNEPVLYKAPGQGAYWDFSTQRGILEDIYAAGAGCMMVRAEALADMERLMGRPWWDDEWDASGKTWGHDIRICERMHKLRELYSFDHDIGWMCKPEAMKLASRKLTDLEETSTSQIANVANQILDEARKLRRDTLIEAGKATWPWRVTLAGWIMCGHFDYQQQKMFAIPADAPCFKNTNTRGYWDKMAITEEAAERLGSASRRGSEAWLHPEIAKIIPDGSNVVDVGCFLGSLGDFLIKTKKCDYFGIDISPKAIEILRSRHMHGEVVNLLDMEFDAENSDKAIFTCLEVLEHLPEEACENTLKQMSKGEWAIISVPDGKIGAPAGEHVQEFTKESFRKLLSKHWKYVEVRKVEPHFLLAVCRHKKTRGRRK